MFGRVICAKQTSIYSQAVRVIELKTKRKPINESSIAIAREQVKLSLIADKAEGRRASESLAISRLK